MRFLTLRRGAAPIPDKQAREVRLYADEDAVLHVLEADGTDTEVGTGGGGGSIPNALLVIDCGDIDATALIENGPTLVYTPDTDMVIFEGRFLVTDYLVGDPLDDTVYQVRVGSAADFAETPAHPVANYGLVAWDSDITLQLSGPQSPVGANPASREPYTDPLYATYVTYNSTLPVDSAVGAWQANHNYALGDWVLDSNGNLQHVTDDGMSGGTEPTWETAAGATTTDGGVEWTNEGNAPTQGSARLLLLAGIPAAP